jgi:AcrR family transcriptional regulator
VGAAFVTDGAKGYEAGDGTVDSRRDEMLRFALDVIAERGIADTRIADVADRAGTSPALVIYYFQTKDNLLTEAVRLAEDLWFAYGFQRLGAVTGAVARLEMLITVNFTPADEVGFPDLGALWIDLWARSLRHDEVARVRREFDVRWRGVIADIVREGQASGEFDDGDADEFATAFTALLDGLSVQLVLDDPSLDPTKAVRISMGFAMDWLGFVWSPSEPVRA